ncbi:hypothetical protein K435DRAFT_881298 [Dendrothele bispora CBS 962.96]|uniref:Uncharacterized protein n=1 Tax=Dendrothele bispora (strain CBS 962.96) TaxID=1314807 RepID=A0A4S8KIG7_DENBC|nr:hypothetical protein K435DRAFT_881298 [Dendrothele bispora CBS 962.96]
MRKKKFCDSSHVQHYRNALSHFQNDNTSAFSDFGWQLLHNPVQPQTGQFSATWQPESKIPEPALIV